MAVINFFRENVEGVGVSCRSDMPQTCNVAEYNPEFLIFHLWVVGITSDLCGSGCQIQNLVYSQKVPLKVSISNFVLFIYMRSLCGRVKC